MRKNDKYITVAIVIWMFILSSFYASVAIPQISGQPYKYLWIGPDNEVIEYERAARDPLPYYWPFDEGAGRFTGLVTAEQILEDFYATYIPYTRETYVPTGQPIIPNE